MISVGGLKRRLEETVKRFEIDRPYSSSNLLPVKTVFQTVMFLHDQKQNPSCEGHSHASGIEQKTGWKVSGVDLWIDARRRQGDLGNAAIGTESAYVIESVIRRGVSPQVAGEDDRPSSENVRMPSLAQELAADANRVSIDAVHRQISSNRVACAFDALQRCFSVTFGTGVRDGYGTIGVNEIVGIDNLSADAPDGHSQRLVGGIAPDDERFPAEWRGCFILASSWAGHGGILMPCSVPQINGQMIRAGEFLPQRILIRPEVIETAWELDALEIRWVG